MSNNQNNQTNDSFDTTMSQKKIIKLHQKVGTNDIKTTTKIDKIPIKVNNIDEIFTSGHIEEVIKKNKPNFWSDYSKTLHDFEQELLSNGITKEDLEKFDKSLKK
jgi:hypothetical protein